MIKPSKLFLIRHAPVKKITGFFFQHNPDAIIKNNKIKKLATCLPDNCDWYVSPLKRTIQTAKALSRYKQYSKIIIENNLVEQSFGDWSGKKISEIWKVINKNKDKHNFSFISPEFSPPNGESFLDQSKRVEIWLKKLKLKAGQSILIITHAGTIRAILSHALQIKPDFAIGLEVTHQSCSVLEMLSKKDNKHKGGQFRLLSFNNVI